MIELNWNALFHLGDSTLTSKRTSASESSDSVARRLADLINNRFVRSYSEEFMSSSEERERGLQFFGGTSTGSSSSKRISPYFDTESISTNVTISEGSAFVHLPCRVKQLGERTVCLAIVLVPKHQVQLN